METKEKNDIVVKNNVFDEYAHLRNSSEFLQDSNMLAIKLLIDSNRYHYLYHHVFGGNGLVPATMIMELFVESATFFMENVNESTGKGFRAAELIDLNIERAIALRLGEKLEVVIVLQNTIENGSKIELDLQIKSGRIQKSGKVIGTRINATCKVIFAKEYFANIKKEWEQEEFDYYQFSPSVYYPYYFPALGSKFQSGTGRFAVSKDRNTIIGEYDCNNKELDFIAGQETKFVLSPLGYDSCLQYTVFLSRIKSVSGRLPVACDHLKLHRKHPQKGLCRVAVNCLHIDDSIMCSNFWSFDEEWNLLLSSENFIVKKDPFHDYSNREEFEKLLSEHKVQAFSW